MAPMREVFRNQYYSIEFDDASRVIRITRTAVPQDVESLNKTAVALPAVIQPMLPARLLLDVRQARGNNTPGFEQAALAVIQRLLENFTIIAVVVQTAVGKLHFQRLSRNHPQPFHVFFDEQEALAYLTSQPL